MASPGLQSFRQFAEELVSNFLQTIMVVDDEAFFPTDEPQEIKQLTTPGAPNLRRPANVTARAEDEANIAVISSRSDALDKTHELNAKKLIEDFAVNGMVCAVIRPKQVEIDSLNNIVYPLARNSDIVVFDWVLHGAQDGAKVKQLVTEITDRACSEDSRVRLLIIYTGQDDLARITEELRLSLVKVESLTVSKKGDYTLESGPVRIAVYAKGNVAVGQDNPALAKRVIKIGDLPRRLVSEFTDMTMGLVPNAAIACLASLRANTHRLLRTFHSGLDAPFISHRAMLNQPEDAGKMLIGLIGSELTAILEGQEISKLIGSDQIMGWLQLKEECGYDFAQRFDQFPRDNIIANVHTMLQSGVESKELTPPLNMFAKNPHKRGLTAKLIDSDESSSDLEYEFARLTSIKSDYRSHPPSLGPGTLLKQIALVGRSRKTFYWVCIQPLCDSLRLTEKTFFPLLRLEPSKDKFDLVFTVDQRLNMSVRTIFSPSKSVMQEFAPDSDGVVRARSVGRRTCFVSTNRRRYQWIGELKFEHTQRIVNRYAAQISRVGLDESEWLRRSGG